MSLKTSQPSRILRFKNFALDLTEKTHLMGVLNVTPDSFSDGGLFFETKSALERAAQMARDGASIIDVGGESTRPGALPVTCDEELRRVIPVIEAIAAQINVPISIDTSKPSVAREAIKAGASMINNIMGSDLDSRMAKVAADFDVPMVLMHIKGEPSTMQKDPFYEDVVSEIISALGDSIRIAEACGVDPDKIIIDPGIGFGKTARHNLEIIKNLDRFKILGKPLLAGPSRKSFIGAVLGIDDPRGRLMGTAAAVAILVANGADMIRVHDVKEMGQVSALAEAIYKGQKWSHS